MSSATPAASPSVMTKATPKSASKQSLVVTLRLSTSILSEFSTPQSTSTPQPRKVSRTKPPVPSSEEESKQDTPAQDNASESNATPGPATSTPKPGSAANPLKRKGVPGPKPGTKRMPPAIDINAPPKPRGKPGPKKRKLDDPNGKPISAAAHKLGPKANQGAINAGLRALDRSGKPCRRWHRNGFQVKSFTGVHWALPAWRGLSKPPPLDAKSSDADASDVKHDGNASSGDDKSGDHTRGPIADSSPPPAAAVAGVAGDMDAQPSAVAAA